MVPGDKVEVIISKVLRWQRFASEQFEDNKVAMRNSKSNNR